MLEAQVGRRKDALPDTQGAGGLSLRRLAVWTHEPLHRMRLLVAIAERCLGGALVGGALASALHAFTKHGDAAYVSLAGAILHEVTAPLWIMLFR